MHGIIREQPSIETPRHRSDETWPEIGSLHFLQSLVEAGKQVEDSVEVIARGRLLRNYLENRWLLVQALASLVDGVKNFGHHCERVGSRGAT